MSVLILALAAAAPVTPTPRIELKPVEGGWQVRYLLDQPARSLHFDIPYGDYRQTGWQSEDRAVRIVATGEAVRAERRDGRPFRAISFRLMPRYREVPRNYAPFAPFSDGGLLIYTGQFHACLNRACNAARSWRVSVSKAGSRIIAPGLSAANDATFVSSGDGSVVYIGTAEALETPQVSAVIDPALDAAVRAQLDELLPRLARYFSGAFGPLPKKPTLFASLDRFPRPNSGLSYQGGTLPGQVFLHFYGSAWREQAARADFVPWFFAHETAHFYHSARSGNAVTSEEDAWVHEGGAEAFAALALTDLGQRDYVERRVASTVDRCATALTALAGKPLTASAAAGTFQNHYDCGLLIHLAIDEELRRTSAGRETLVTVWNDFLRRVRSGARWTGATYLKVARDHGLSGDLSSALADLTTKPQRLTGPELRTRLGL